MFKIIALTTILSTIGAISSEMYIPSMPYITAWFHTNPTVVQYSLSAYMLGTTIPALFFGSLADIYGRRRIILIALTIGLAGTIGCLFSQSIAFFILCRFIQGLGFSSTNGLGRALLRDYYSGEEFAKYSSYLSMAFAFSVDVTPFFGGILQKHFNWHAIFVFLTLFNCISLFVAAKFPFREIPFKGGFKWREMLSSYYQISCNKVFMRYSIVAGCMYSVFMCYLTVASFLWEKRLGVSPEDFGLLTLFLSFFYVGSCYLNSFLIRFGVDRVLQYGLLLVLSAGIGLMVFGAFFPGKISFFLLLGMVFAGSGLVFSNSSSMGMSSIKENFSSASAFYSFISIVVAAVFSAIISQFNALSFLPLAIMISCLSAVSLVIHVRRKNILQVNYAE
jgi:MFS family permease